MILNKYCAKIIFSHLDIIGVRSNSLLANDYNQRIVFEDAFRFADRVIAISDFTKNDAVAYYNYLPDLGKKMQTIYQGLPEGDLFTSDNDEVISDRITAVVEEGNYILLLGNQYPHKFISEVATELAGINKPVVVVGLKNSLVEADNIFYIESGRISDQFMNSLKKHSSVIVFPSLYEGFGLPILEAAQYGKPLILADTALNREIVGKFNVPNVNYFTKVKDVPSLIQTLQAKKLNQTLEKVRTITDYNRDVIHEVVTLGRSKDYNASKLRERWYYFSKINQYQGVNIGANIGKNIVTHASRIIKQFTPGMYPIAKKYYKKLRS